MASLNAKLDDFINFVKNEGSVSIPQHTQPTQHTSISHPPSPKKSPQKYGKPKSPAASLRPNFEVEARLIKMENEIQTLTFQIRNQTATLSSDNQKPDDLSNLAHEIDTALRTLETRLLTTIRTNVDAQKFELNARIEESNRIL
jgi:hypothetical protein